MAKDCPKCGLLNPPSAQRCDCGYDFDRRQMERSYVEPKQLRRPAAAFWAGGGLAMIGVYLYGLAVARLVGRVFCGAVWELNGPDRLPSGARERARRAGADLRVAGVSAAEGQRAGSTPGVLARKLEPQQARP